MEILPARVVFHALSRLYHLLIVFIMFTGRSIVVVVVTGQEGKEFPEINGYQI